MKHEADINEYCVFHIAYFMLQYYSISNHRHTIDKIT